MSVARLREVPAGSEPAVELSVEAHELPLTLVAALEAAVPGGLPICLTRTGPDRYRLDIYDDDGCATGHAVVLPNPGPGRYARDAALRVKVGVRVASFVLAAEQLAAVLVAAGWGVTPPDLSRMQLWEAADGLGATWYASPWTKDW